MVNYPLGRGMRVKNKNANPDSNSSLIGNEVLLYVIFFLDTRIRQNPKLTKCASLTKTSIHKSYIQIQNFKPWLTNGFIGKFKKERRKKKLIWSKYLGE